MPNARSRSLRWRTLLFVCTVVALAACTGDEPAPTTVAASDATSAPGSPEVSPQGRILFSRIMASGEIRYFVVGADGSGEQPFLPGKEFEGRNLSPDGSRLAIVAANGQGVLVGGSRWGRR